MKLNRCQLKIVEDLNRAASDALEAGHPFEAAIINFQRLEVLLRLATIVQAKALGVNKLTVDTIEDKQSFRDIVVFFSILRPKNRLSERLLALNTKRNSFIHGLFFTKFTSIESLKREMKTFCRDTIELIQALTELLESPFKKVIVVGTEAYEIDQMTEAQIAQVFQDLSKILSKAKAQDFGDIFAARSPIVQAVMKNGRDEAFRWVEMVTEIPAQKVPMTITRPQFKHFLTSFLEIIFFSQ